MEKIAVLNLRREIVGHAATEHEAMVILRPLPNVAGAPFRRMERLRLADDDAKHPGRECYRPVYGGME
jgi:hypothetical protein